MGSGNELRVLGPSATIHIYGQLILFRSAGQKEGQVRNSHLNRDLKEAKHPT
jgi:hypothetical protein